ncbi:hypothetical protein S40288_09907 [Stachybotrys chartarum IBT 40288]|nr:hypothetical protein S40288_09907 [Stachybotrys chartarum IBT 40288]
MDDFLAAVGVQAMRYAIRSGIALTSTFAISQQLSSLREILDNKIKVISPVIDLVELKSGHGNASLASALPLTKSLRSEIISLGHRIQLAATAQEHSQQASVSKARGGKAPATLHLHTIISDIKLLLDRIDREIPLLQLAITASGESLSTLLPTGVSPSRLLQASTLLIIGDTRHAQSPDQTVEIGPVFGLSLYMLFKGHASASCATHNGISCNDPGPKTSGPSNKPAYGLGDGDRKPLWQEVIHKARVRLCRAAQDSLPSSDGVQYQYHLEIIQDLDDGRVHDRPEDSGEDGSVGRCGLKELIPIQQISKIFYTNTGKILNVGDASSNDSMPVLLLKRDVAAGKDSTATATGTDSVVESVSGFLPSKDIDEADEQAEVDRQLQGHMAPTVIITQDEAVSRRGSGTLPKHLDPEWLALEMFEEDICDDSASDDTDDTGSEAGKPVLPPRSNNGMLDSILVRQLRNISLSSSSPSYSAPSLSVQGLNGRRKMSLEKEAQDFVDRSPFRAITTSLSLLEMMIRLAGLQEFQQRSHLAIPDHVMTFFLEETSTTGLVGEAQWKARSETKRTVGFDPYADAEAHSSPKPQPGR